MSSTGDSQPPPRPGPGSWRERLAAFASERDWDQFHAPKNLAMALIAECAELVEHFLFEAIDVVAERVPAVKPQSAFFEALGAPGAVAWENVVAAASGVFIADYLSTFVLG